MLRTGLLGALMTALIGQATAQIAAAIDYFAHLGEFEWDYYKRNLQDGISIYSDPPTLREQVQFSIDTTHKHSGVGSQRVRLERAGGAAGWLTFTCGIDFNAHLTPAVGEPLLVRIAYRAEGFQGARYRIRIVSGDQSFFLVPETAESTSGWNTRSMVVPVLAHTDGTRRFFVEVGLYVDAGAAQGTLWVDALQAISTRVATRADRLPNGMRLALFTPRNRDATWYLDSGLPIQAVLGYQYPGMSLQRHFSNLIWAPYVHFCGTLPESWFRHNADLYNYDDVMANRQDWILRDANGNPIQASFYNWYYVDIGRAEVRERAWQSLRDFLNRVGRPRYVMLDDVNAVLTRWVRVQGYPTLESWEQAVLGWFHHVGANLQREFGAQFIPNADWNPGFYLRGIQGHPDAPGVSILPYIGGFMIEHIFTHARRDGTGFAVAYRYGTASDVGDWRPNNRHRDRIRLATEYPDRITILNPTLPTPEAYQQAGHSLAEWRRWVRFVIAGCLIVQHENTLVAITFNPRADNETRFLSREMLPELFTPLGMWRGNYRIEQGDLVSGGLFVREYEHGIVVLNPRTDRSYTFTLPRDLYDWDGNLRRAGETLTIEAQTGHVFFSAPDITVELNPRTVEVLPGQTVSFTVTYRNRGTASGTNVRIAVPLAQGMTLIGSNPTARLEDGQVVWIVPQVPAGGQGTLQFTVRVE